MNKDAIKKVFEDAGIAEAAILADTIYSQFTAIQEEHTTQLAEQNDSAIATLAILTQENEQLKETIESLTEEFESSRQELVQFTLDLAQEEYETKLEVERQLAVESIQEEHQHQLESLVEFTLEKAQEEHQETIKDIVQFTLDRVEESNKDQLEALAQYTMDHVSEHYDQLIDSILTNVAEEYIQETDDQLELLSEQMAHKVVGLSIAESLDMAGVSLEFDESELLQRIDELEEELNINHKKIKIYEESLNDIQKELLIQESVADLSDLQKERVLRLTNNITYHDKESFQKALKYVQESIGINKHQSRKTMPQPIDDETMMVEESYSKPAVKTPKTNVKTSNVEDIVKQTVALMQRRKIN